jgi:hypothetical protein
VTARGFYRFLLRLHPRPFRERFGVEIVDMFDDVRKVRGTLPPMCDAVVSLFRQWVLRPSRRRVGHALAEGGTMADCVREFAGQGREVVLWIRATPPILWHTAVGWSLAFFVGIAGAIFYQSLR